MSRAEEFKRLLEHAAARLREDEPKVRNAFDDQRASAPSGYHVNQSISGLLSYTVTVTYTTTLLDMLCSFLVDEKEDPGQ